MEIGRNGHFFGRGIIESEIPDFNVVILGLFVYTVCNARLVIWFILSIFSI